MRKKLLQNLLIKHFFLLACISFSCLNSDAQSSKIDSLKKSLSLTENDEEKFKIATELTKLNTKTKPALALEYAEESARLANMIKSDSFLQRANLNLATVYLQLENYPKSVQFYYKVIHNSQKKPDPNILFAAYVNLGTIYLMQNDFKNAISKYTKALTYLGDKTERNLERKAGLLNNLGGTYKEIKDYRRAEIYLNEALKISKQIGDQGNVANILNNQGQVYQHLGKNELALKHYLEAMAIREKTRDTMGIASSNYRLGQYYYSLGDYTAAEPYLKKVTILKKDLGSYGLLSQSSSYLYNIYKQQGKYKEALAAIELQKETNDSLFNEARTRKIAQLEMQFEFDRKQSELQTKQREKDLYSWIIAISLGLSLIIITLLFFLQKNKARRSQLNQAHLQLEKKNLEKDIELKDKELTAQVLHLVQKNELIDVISEKLLEIKQNMGPESQTAVQKVVIDLQSNLQPELLKEFKLRFQNIHKDFFDILNERFPDLSPSELRLCAFLKLNLTTKEISAITNISPKSIEIARTRLRKKLNLTGTDTNLVIFLSQLDQTPVGQ
ncbi:tetratricopeptide repeat protein [Pedobacter nyackensis]|uniref:Tetratricopeptide repeat-containing protein n=1 Tax=Pedobacter nyackensis TaxID=475255 RepID=A0A1W2CQE1_9SPHI|nr:tetratricopeptide repeat protein [Pedobacter nyackensis]SMC87477.1 Tetratricopeptide repeat-containing protein [Pedobacter nyackensis]